MVRTAIGSMLVVLILGLAPGAVAGERVAIGKFRGPQASRIQGAFENGLMGRYYVVPDFNVSEEARRQRVHLRDDRAFGVVGRALDVRAFVSADVQKGDRGGAWQVQLVVRRGDTGTALGTIVLADRRLDGLEAQLATRAPQRVRTLLARAARPRALAVAPTPTSSARGRIGADPDLTARARARAGADADIDADVSAGAGDDGEPEVGAPPTLFELAVGARVFGRSFSYVQNLSDSPGYQLPRAFASALELALYPAGWLSPGLRGLSLTGALEYGLGVRSHMAGSDERTATQIQGLAAGLGYQVGRGALTATPRAGYALHTLSTGLPAPMAPEVRYRLLSAGADARWMPATGLALLARAAYLHVLDAGALIGGRFPRATVRGLEAEAALSFVLSRALELRAAAGVRRLGFAMHSVPGDRWVAGGAIDQTTWAGVGVAYRR